MGGSGSRGASSETQAGETEAPRALTPAHGVHPLGALFSLGHAMFERELSTYCINSCHRRRKGNLAKDPVGIWLVPVLKGSLSEAAKIRSTS